MFDIHLRGLKDRLIDPIVPLIPNIISPGHITATGFIFGLLACITATTPHSESLSLSFWLMNRLLDCLDGSTARHRGLASELGGFLDLLSDFIVYSAIPIATGYGQPMTTEPGMADISLWLGIAFVEATFHVNNFVLFYSAAIASKLEEGELTSITMKPALIEGFESGLIFLAMFLWPQHIGTFCWLMGVLVTVGVAQRSWSMVQILSYRSAQVAQAKTR